MRVVAIDRFEYANKLRLPGDEFDTDNDEHARLLMLARRVRIAPETITSRDLKSDDEPQRKPNPYRDKYRDKYRNRYNHRAMRADE